jgi:hypothetical protein
MKPETRAKKDKCTLVASVDHGKLRVLGVQDEPLVILEGKVLELRAVGGQVHAIQRMPRGPPPLRRPPIRIPRPTSRSGGPLLGVS